jgi:hypothetical protein
VSLVNQALGLIDTADSLTSLGATAADSLLKGREQGVNSRIQRRMEAISTYNGTDKQSLTIDFILFTKSNFLLDVFKPLMFLTSLSYPKRTLNGNFGDTSEKVGNTLKSVAANNPQFNETIRTLLRASANGIQDAGQFLEKVENALSRYGGIGPYRYYISRRPEYMSIRHASGLFTFPLAYISNVSYDFQGPWYNYEHQPVAYAGDIEKLLQSSVQQAAASKGFLDSITDAFKNAFNAPANTSQTNNPQSTFVNPTNPLSLAGNIRTYQSDAAYIQANKLPYAYPSWAKVSVTVHNALPMFRDDFLQSFYSTSQEGLVTISQNESGFDKSLNLANGVAKQNAFQ